MDRTATMQCPKMAMRKDDQLLAISISIFGDIVVGAFMCVQDFGYDKPWLKEQLLPYRDSSDKFKIDIGGDTIRLVFNNGKVVEFQSSEWGSISRATTEGYELDME